MNNTHSPYHSLSTTSRVTVGLLALTTLLGLGSAAVAAADELASCWTSEPGALGSIDHPTGALDIVLRMQVGGGFVPIEIAFLESPTFTLYGNNVAIFRPATDAGDLTDPVPPYACSVLSPQQVDHLLTFALDEGGLRDADERYANPFIVDTPNTAFTVDADGVDKVVVVEALGFDEQAPDPEARARFGALAAALSDFGSQVEASTPYDVPLYRAMLTEPWIEEPGEPAPWPWDEQPGDLFGDGLDVIATLTPEQVAQVTSVPNGGQGYILLETPDGTLVSLAIRPLLPDEIANGGSSS